MGDRGTVSLYGFKEMCYEDWPDLADGAAIAILPLEDMRVIVAATEGQLIPAHREMTVITLNPRERPHVAMPRLSIWRRISKIFWGEW